jgi:hypothetical protein
MIARGGGLMIGRGYILYFVASLTVACSSSSSSNAPPPCNENPWTCPGGQTCWPATQGTFACLNSGAGKAGDACQDTVGSATCGAGLACLQVGASGGLCSPYCDNTDTSHACAAGETCQTALLLGGSGPQFQVCVGAGSSTGDAGAVALPDASNVLPILDAGASDGAAGSVSAACTAWANHDVAQCPSDDPRSTLAECSQGESLYPPEGCGAEWSAYETCATQATYSSCANGPDGCDTQQNAYFSCQSRFASSTSCSRTPAQDAKCSASAPFGYGCLGTLPAGCVQLPPTGGATIACCPTFAPM